MNRFLVLLLLGSTSLIAWDDHPDREPDRSVFDSQCNVESGYDWSNRDPDSKDNDSNSSRDSNPGTICPPDRDK